MAVKLHRCGNTWLKLNLHPCWKVQKALDEAEVDYELVKHPSLRGRRKGLEELSGQKVLPAIELSDGKVIREESDDMVERIRSGKLESESGGGGISGFFKRGG